MRKIKGTNDIQKKIFSNIGRFIHQNVQNRILETFRINNGISDLSIKSYSRKTQIKMDELIS